jgi:hypothetical protein
LSFEEVKVNKFLGITLIVLALAIAIVPTFTDCQSQGKAITLPNGTTTPMKCHWTGVAEIATGVPLLAVGAMMTASRRKGNLRILGGMGGILGVFAILLPTQLIGVCQTSMLCHTAMQPSLVVLGSLAIVSSGMAIMLSRKAAE